MDNGLWAGNATQSSWENPACETDVRNFRRCMDENKGDMTICGWYLDQLVRFESPSILALRCSMRKRIANDYYRRLARLLLSPIKPISQRMLGNGPRFFSFLTFILKIPEQVPSEWALWM